MRTLWLTISNVMPIVVGIVLASVTPAKAQNGYALVGSARSGASTDCYQLTQSGIGQTGAVWFDKPIRLTESFELVYSVNFGNNPLGADGIVMVFQTQGKQALGGPSGGIGYKGLASSLGVEFDTNQNFEAGDPVADHISLLKDGVFDHRLNTSFAPPVPILATSATVKDGRDHSVRVTWNASSQTLQVDVDCVSRINQSVNLVYSIFAGVQEVYWGFTSATGTRGNTHSVCIQKQVILPDTIRACRNATISLLAPVSFTNQYEWAPSNGLTNTQVRNPQLTVGTSQLYTVTYYDRCALPKVDSVYVFAKTPDLDLGNDRRVCINESVELTPTLNPAGTPVTYHWSTGLTNPKLKPQASGQYSLTVTAGECSVSDSVSVTFNPLPMLAALTDSSFDCPAGQPIRFDPKAIGSSLQYLWTPEGSRDSTLTTGEPGEYTVKVTTGFGCSIIKGFTILNNCPPNISLFVPDAFTPNGDGANEFFAWKTSVAVDAKMTVFNRWGEAVFQSESAQNFWDGTWNGYCSPQGEYTWRIEYRSLVDKRNQWFTKTGKVLLLK